MLIQEKSYDAVFKKNELDFDIKVFSEKIFHYDRLVFCCDIVNEKNLKEKWEDIVEIIAIDIQTKIDKIISKMNIYVLFFVENLNDINLKIFIENNKFSSRKIIIDKKMNDINDLELFVNNRLFNIETEFKENSNNAIEELFCSTDKKLYDLYMDGSEKINYKNVITKYISK